MEDFLFSLFWLHVMSCSMYILCCCFFTAAPKSAKILCCKETRVMSSEDDTGGEAASGSFWEVRGMMVYSFLSYGRGSAEKWYQYLLRTDISRHQISLYLYGPTIYRVGWRKSGMHDHSPVPTFSVIAEHLGGILDVSESAVLEPSDRLACSVWEHQALPLTH